MVKRGWKSYLWNGFVLLVPVLLWNILFARYLPPAFGGDIFWKDIPPFVSMVENITRIVIFVLPAMMFLSFKTRAEKTGLALYLFGSLVYYASWAAQIFAPDSPWSTSAVGFMAPAFTTAIFFVGIGLVGRKAFFPVRHMSAIYIALSLVFVVFHSLHTYIVFTRL